MIAQLNSIIRDLADVEKELVKTYNSRKVGRQLLISPIQVSRRRAATVMRRLELLERARVKRTEPRDTADTAHARLISLARIV